MWKEISDCGNIKKTLFSEIPASVWVDYATCTNFVREICQVMTGLVLLNFIKWSFRQFCHLTNVASFNSEVDESIWTISGNFSGST